MKRWTLAAGFMAGLLCLAAGNWMTGFDTAVSAQTANGSNDGSIASVDGSIALIDTAVLASDRPGILDFIDLEEGDEVRADQKVAGLKDGIARSALATATEKARNDVQKRYAAKATEVAEKELEIAKEANSRLPGTVPLLEVEKLVLAAERGRLQIEQAEFEQTVAKLTQNEAEEALKTYEVFAPFDGVVTKVLRKRGEAVRQGDPILEVISTQRVKVEAYITVASSYRVKPGDAVDVQLDLTGEKNLPYENLTFKGVVKFVEQRVELTNKVKVTAYVLNSKGLLKEGLRARMTIHPGQTFRTTSR